MSDAQPGPGAQPAEEKRPLINVISQYVKDFSFENPNAPASLQLASSQPDIKVNVAVNAEALKDSTFEVVLHISATAQSGETVAFITELVYAGQFAITNAPREVLPVVLLVECPRMLFPFARRVIADATRDGGFPPLLLSPIDFVSLFRQQRMAAQGKAPQSAPPT
ncbi:MAG: protein-export chaperone SecB [Alphaproteobacteria bacterium]|nr:protein-export chaperone SecB [Alphaproteobacteria bacterium]